MDNLLDRTAARLARWREIRQPYLVESPAELVSDIFRRPPSPAPDRATGLNNFLDTGIEALPDDHFTATSTLCPICKETIPEFDTTTNNQVVKINQCGHIFHRFCLHSWFTTGSNTCPLDRRLLFHADGIVDDSLNLGDFLGSEFEGSEYGEEARGFEAAVLDGMSDIVGDDVGPAHMEERAEPDESESEESESDEEESGPFFYGHGTISLRARPSGNQLPDNQTTLRNGRETRASTSSDGRSDITASHENTIEMSWVNIYASRRPGWNGQLTEFDASTRIRSVGMLNRDRDRGDVNLPPTPNSILTWLRSGMAFDEASEDVKILSPEDMSGVTVTSDQLMAVVQAIVEAYRSNDPFVCLNIVPKRSRLASFLGDLWT